MTDLLILWIGLLVRCWRLRSDRRGGAGRLSWPIFSICR